MKLEDFKLEEISILSYIKFYKDLQSRMVNPNWLGDFNENNLKDVISIGGKIFVFKDGKEIACSLMYIPATSKALDKFKLDYDYSVVGECGPIMVNCKYIGNGLQSQMLLYLENYVKSINQKFIITTVHPDNIYSIKNFENNGYALVNSFEFKRGKRLLYVKNIS